MNIKCLQLYVVTHKQCGCWLTDLLNENHQKHILGNLAKA